MVAAPLRAKKRSSLLIGPQRKAQFHYGRIDWSLSIFLLFLIEFQTDTQSLSIVFNADAFGIFRDLSGSFGIFHDLSESLI